ncbi:glucosamine-6-phosphate deaminase [uncultured Microbacterium sp.]|uniref:glucosamine-6-phosphate deaminase n=1 Tax=uncultured Microbacterium sp. TaxID=191216 RepID=UPI0028D3366D|nr:glucosamine-6-phosphate deaminase [uncultured Microbacterium sp.]
MQVVITTNESTAGEFAADIIERRAHAGALRVIGVATGSSPLPVYDALARRDLAGVRAARAFALDEYVGLPAAHPESYRSVVSREVTARLGLDPERVHVPDGSVDRLSTAGERYENLIALAGGIDVQILGIGTTGHIGFNEPTSSLASRTRVKTLTEQTRRDNARFFPSLDEVPRHCVTQGLGTILDAREVVLIAVGSRKAAAVAAAVEGPLTSMCPASVLQLHPHATVIVDEAAAAELRLRSYYTEVFAHRPAWQV